MQSASAAGVELPSRLLAMNIGRFCRRNACRNALWIGFTAASQSIRAINAVLVFMSIAVLATACMGREARASSGNNLIVISIDTLRADMLSCYGYDRPTSPAIDGVAQEGVLFEDVSATSPWTLPSHASIFTGLYPNRHGVKSRRQSLPDNVVTLAQLFSNHGFATSAIVNFPYLGERYGLQRGFQHFEYLKPTARLRRPSRIRQHAEEWLSAHSKEPFFLFVHFFDVHSSYRSLRKWEKQFVRPSKSYADGSSGQLMRFRSGKYSMSDLDAPHLIDLYVAGIRQIDRQISKLLEFLDSKQLTEHTVVVITSDHGEEFFEHGSVLHGRTQFREVLSVPLILRGPGIPPGRRISEPVSLVDIAPTLVSLFGLRTDVSFDGVDLGPYWNEQNGNEQNGKEQKRKEQNGKEQKAEAKPDRFLFGEAAAHKMGRDDITRSVRFGRYKLILNEETSEAHLYDLETDPAETVDISQGASKIFELLMKRLGDFMNVEAIEGEELPPITSEEARLLKAMGYVVE